MGRKLGNWSGRRGKMIKWKKLAADTFLYLTAPLWFPLVLAAWAVIILIVAFIRAYTDIKL